MTTSCVLIVPASLRDKANTLAEAMGWGPGSYAVPLSADGSEPITHYGLRTWASDEFVAMLQGAAQGQMPPALTAASYPPADFAAVVGNLAVSLQPAMEGHFAAAIAAQGLAMVERL